MGNKKLEWAVCTVNSEVLSEGIGELADEEIARRMQFLHRASEDKFYKYDSKIIKQVDYKFIARVSGCILLSKSDARQLAIHVAGSSYKFFCPSKRHIVNKSFNSLVDNRLNLIDSPDSGKNSIFVLRLEDAIYRRLILRDIL